METGHQAEIKPNRRYFDTYLQLLRNSVGSAMFRNFYIEDEHGNKIDALDNGDNSCAFYVSSVLTIFGKLTGVHGTVQNTLKDMEDSGWQKVTDLQPGDVVVWEKVVCGDGEYEHIGFYLGDNHAVSTSTDNKAVAEHALYFGKANRQIEQVWRHNTWD